MIAEHTLTTLEFPKVISLIEGQCRTPYGHEEVRKITPIYDRDTIERKLTETSQMKDIILFGAAFPIARMEDDIRDLIHRSQIEGIFLDPKEMLQIRELVEISIDIARYDPENREKFPSLMEYIGQVRAFPELKAEINKAIDDDGSVKDSASSKLKHIRMDIADSRRKIMAQLDRVLAGQKKQAGWQDDVITQRNGRYVIPVPSNQYRGDLGILHERSQSGATYYVEPTVTVELNNRINLLFQEERLEIDRILRALTAEIASRASALLENVRMIGILDAIYASAAFGRQVGANKPILRDEPGFNLIDARHPLLVHQFKDVKKVVPTSVGLDESRQGVLITGPNTGGKTITVKTIGLMVVMAQSGLLIPADEKSEIGIFRRVFADIGDEQSIELSLSTFSSHIKNIISALDGVSENSLVLFDEIGAGTDPKEGAALAEAIILYILGTGARLVVTTHYSQLKTLPLDHPEIENASLEFDRKTLAPTYLLQLGIPGSSYALEIASRLGMPKEITGTAGKLLGAGERSLGELISSLENELSQVRRDQTELSERLARTRQLEEYYRTQTEKLENEVEKAKKEALAETEEILDTTRKETERLVADIRKSQAAKEKVRELHNTLKKKKGQLQKVRGEIEKPRKKPDQTRFGVGDRVRIISLNQEGDIEQLVGSSRAKVRVKNVTTTVDLRNLEKLERPESRKLTKTTAAVKADTDISPEIHLRGMTVEEAMEALDRFIDKAVIANLKQIYVIHGKGTGRLRRQLTEFLKQHREVESLRLGNWNEGGAGVTIVKLKE